MPEFLRTAFQADVAISWLDVVIRLVAAFALGCVVSLVYRTTHGAQARDRQAFMATLVLLTILIAMISSVIGDNVARAFSLVGALSIVRFRTVVEDTRDTAFVILAVGVGLALGSGHFIIPILMIPAAWLAAAIFSPHMNSAARISECDVEVRLGLGQDDRDVLAELEKHATSVETVGASTVRQGTGVLMTYRARLPRDSRMMSVMQAISELPGVAGVEIQPSSRDRG